MFYNIYKLSILLVIPLIFVLIDVSVQGRRRRPSDSFDIFCKWFLFWTLGVSTVAMGLMHIFNPAYITNLMNIPANDFTVIKELGAANCSIGLLAVLALPWKSFRKPAAIIHGSYTLLCTLQYIMQIDTIQLEEIVTLTANTWIVLVAVLVLIKEIIDYKRQSVYL